MNPLSHETIWGNLEEIFESKDFSQVGRYLASLNPSTVNFFNVAHLAMVFADLHQANPTPGSDSRMAGYALTSGLCYLESLYKKEAKETLQWMKKNEVDPRAIEILETAIIESKNRRPFKIYDEGRFGATDSFHNKTPESTENFQVIPTSLLNFLSPPEFLALTKTAKVKKLQSGEILFREGDHPGAFYMIVDGAVELSSSFGFKKRLEIGNFFGELGLLSNIRRTATIKSVASTKLLEFSKDDFDRTIENFPSLKKRIIEFHQIRLFLTSFIRVEAFRDANEESLRQIYPLFRSIEVKQGKHLSADEVHDNYVMMVVDGELERSQSGIDLKMFGPGDVVGTPEEKYNISFQSPTGCRLLACNKEAFKRAKQIIATHRK